MATLYTVHYEDDSGLIKRFPHEKNVFKSEEEAQAFSTVLAVVGDVKNPEVRKMMHTDPLSSSTNDWALEKSFEKRDEKRCSTDSEKKIYMVSYKDDNGKMKAYDGPLVGNGVYHFNCKEVAYGLATTLVEDGVTDFASVTEYAHVDSSAAINCRVHEKFVVSRDEGGQCKVVCKGDPKFRKPRRNSSQ